MLSQVKKAGGRRSFLKGAAGVPGAGFWADELLEKYNLAWLEDMVPWQYTDLLKKISDAVDIPILTGLGVTLNDEVMKQHPAEPGFFEPTPQWNTDRTNDRQWS